ncbi:MAG: two-component system sensor histidine kinase NtrB [Bdellovibrionota bacterium]
MEALVNNTKTKDGLIINEQISKQKSFLESSFSNFIASAKKLEENYNLLKLEVVGLKEELKQKDIEIKKREHLATIGQTASAIAHEIRNPLGAMKLFVSILKSDLKDETEDETEDKNTKRNSVQNTLKQIDACISSLDNVVSNVLQFSKNQDEVLTPVNIKSIIKEQLSIIKNMSKKEIEICEQYSNDAIFVLGNEASLSRVFYNLFLNSVQAQKEKIFIKVSVNAFHDKVIVQISDKGGGIREDVIDKIFEPFVSTKNEGTGLGLAVVKQILDKHHAKISVRNNKNIRNNKNNGAIFDIVFLI